MQALGSFTTWNRKAALRWYIWTWTCPLSIAIPDSDGHPASVIYLHPLGCLPHRLLDTPTMNIPADYID